MDTHKQILLVEDEEILRRMYVKKLMSEQFDVLEAADSDQAFTVLQTHTPAVILLDVMLPGKMNGLEILETLKHDNALKSIPVIMLTNLGSEEESAKNAGAQGYFIKANTTLDELVAKINEQLQSVSS